VIQLSDLRYALRLWRRYPSLVLVAGISLGLGIGATTTMYSVVNNVSHYPLHFKDVDRLAVLWTTDKERGNGRQSPDWETVQAVLEHGRSFEAFGLFQGDGAPVTLTGTEVSRVSQMPVDVNGLSITGVAPFLGRTYRLEDFEDTIKQKEARSIVVSYETWQRLLGGVPDVIGKTIRVDGDPRTVIGVMPRGFRLVPWVDDIAFWAANDLRRIPKAPWMVPVGRLKPGVTPATAQAEATLIVRQVLESRGQKPGGAGARVELLHEAYFGDARNGLTFLLGAVSFVLLIACANVANLLLAAGAARQKELAVRAAAGAGRLRLVQQLLTESLLLSLVGCGIGLALTFAGIRLFALIIPDGFPDLLRHNPIDLRVLGFALAISVFSSLLFGLVPALQASRLDLNHLLKEGGRGGSGTRRRGRNALLVAEVALAMVLLVGSGLMMRGFLREQSELPGFDTERLLTGEVLLGGTRYFEKTPQDMNLVTPECEAFFDQVLERVRALPGVRQAGIVSRLPTNVWPIPFAIIGRPAPEPGKEPRADFNEVDAQALTTLGIRLLRGRGIEEPPPRGWRSSTGPSPTAMSPARIRSAAPSACRWVILAPCPSRSPSRGRSSASWPTSPTRASWTKRRPPSTSPSGSTCGSTRGRTSGSTPARCWRSAPRSSPWAWCRPCKPQWHRSTATRPRTTSRPWTIACGARLPWPTAASSPLSSPSSARSPSCSPWWVSTA
jgi:putative ABC transport system permease protein